MRNSEADEKTTPDNGATMKAANDERHELTMMEALPVDLLTHTLVFMDVSSRAKLASCNASLQARIYHDCAKAWETIDLPFYTRMTDLELSLLLTKVNARQRTKSFNLTHCLFIQGTGLMPLRMSRVLETVNLHKSEAWRNPTPALSILRYSIPYKLMDVILDELVLDSDITLAETSCGI